MTARSEVGRYLESIAHYPQGEGDGSRDALIQGHLKLVVWRAKRFKRPRGVGLMELISVGNEALILAADEFDRTRGFKFTTFATATIERRILNYLNSGVVTGAIRVPEVKTENPGSERLLSLAAKAKKCSPLWESIRDRGTEDPAEVASRKDLEAADKAKLDGLFSQISKREREILFARADGKTQRQLGKLHGVTYERIRQIERRTIHKLRTLAGVA